MHSCNNAPFSTISCDKLLGVSHGKALIAKLWHFKSKVKSGGGCVKLSLEDNKTEWLSMDLSIVYLIPQSQITQSDTSNYKNGINFIKSGSSLSKVPVKQLSSLSL